MKLEQTWRVIDAADRDPPQLLHATTGWPVDGELVRTVGDRHGRAWTSVMSEGPVELSGMPWVWLNQWDDDPTRLEVSIVLLVPEEFSRGQWWVMGLGSVLAMSLGCAAGELVARAGLQAAWLPHVLLALVGFSAFGFLLNAIPAMAPSAEAGAARQRFDPVVAQLEAAMDQVAELTWERVG